MHNESILYRWSLENKLDLHTAFLNVFYHFSLINFTDVKDINGKGEISFFLSKPDKKNIELLRRNGFYSYGKPNQRYLIYSVNILRQVRKIKWFYIAQSTDEPAINSKFGEEYFNKKKPLSYKDKSEWLEQHGYTKTFYTSYGEMMEYLKPEWFQYDSLVKRQIELCNTKHSDYKSMYAPFIPHLIVGVEKYQELDVCRYEVF